MRIAIIGNGEFVPAKTKLLGYDCIIAADGGMRHCRQLGIAPQYCIGDGDSLTPADKALTQVQLSADQNTTDLQKALGLAKHLAAERNYIVDLFAMTSGDRLDHTLFALQQLASQPQLELVYTPHQQIRCIRTTYVWENALNQTVSLLPTGATATVALTGFAWSSQAVTIDNTHPGISNMITAAHATVTVATGSVFSFEPVLWT